MVKDKLKNVQERNVGARGGNETHVKEKMLNGSE